MHLQEYLDWKKSYTKPGTYPNYERWVTRFREVVGKEGENYTLEDISKFRAHLIEAGYAPKNIQYGLYLVRDYLTYLISLHGLDFPLRLFRIRQERSNSHYPVNEQEARSMIDSLSRNEPVSLQRKVMLSILFETGIRGGELLSIRLSDLTHRKAIIRNEKNHRSRMVSWSEETEELLQFYLHLRTEMICKEDWLFVSFKWRPTRRLTTRQLERIVGDIRRQVGIEAMVRPHSFRHGFVHRKLQEGVPITTVSQMLGHSSTMNVINYAQLTSKEMHEAWGITN